MEKCISIYYISLILIITTHIVEAVEDEVVDVVVRQVNNVELISHCRVLSCYCRQHLSSVDTLI